MKNGLAITLDEATKILEDYPAAQKLLFDVCEFFGSSLQMNWIDGETSAFSVESGQATVKPVAAQIKLANTPRTPAALTHELLHLGIRIERFPMIRSYSAKPFIEKFLDELREWTETITNIVDHDIFHTKYIDLGLPTDQFALLLPPSFSYLDLAKKYQRSKLPQQMMWLPKATFLVEYFRHFVSQRHLAEYPQDFAQSAESAGNRVVPGFLNACREVRSWVADGRHRSAAGYPAAMQKLMNIFELPAINSFTFLERTEEDSSAPVAIVRRG